MKSAAIFLLIVPVWCVAQQDPGIECVSKLAQESRFTAIAAKLPLKDATNIPFEMLADESVPTQAERQAIAAWVTAHQACGKSAEAYREQHYPPQVNALLIQANNRFYVIAAELFNSKLTYAEANRRVQSVVDDLRNKVATLIQQAVAEKAAKQEATKQAQQAQEAARLRDESAQREAQRRYQQAQEDQEIAMRRQAAFQYFLSNMRAFEPKPLQPYQMPPLRQSIQTNCYRIGNQVNCTTQ